MLCGVDGTQSWSMGESCGESAHFRRGMRYSYPRNTRLDARGYHVGRCTADAERSSQAATPQVACTSGARPYTGMGCQGGTGNHLWAYDGGSDLAAATMRGGTLRPLRL